MKDCSCGGSGSGTIAPEGGTGEGAGAGEGAVAAVISTRSPAAVPAVPGGCAPLPDHGGGAPLPDTADVGPGCVVDSGVVGPVGSQPPGDVIVITSFATVSLRQMQEAGAPNASASASAGAGPS
jgi:hypothetical protein